MNKAFILACVALLAIPCVHSQIMGLDEAIARAKQGGLEQPPLRRIHLSGSDPLAKLQKFITLMNEEDDSNELLATQNNEIGPNFNEEQFVRKLRHDARAAGQRVCKKLSGEDSAYKEAHDARRQAKRCIRSWIQTEGLETDLEVAKVNGNLKPLLKKVCEKRSGLNACIENHKAPMKRCLYPHLQENVEKVLRIMNNMLDLVCENKKNDFAILDGEGERCLTSNRVRIKTCANKAAYSVAKRTVEKWIEDEHFTLEMSAEDCKEFDAAKNCFVSSVENCANPTVKDTIASAFQIIRNETECSKTSECNTLN